MPYGRGGAGNIQAVEQQTSRVAADLEAATKPSAAGSGDVQSTLPAKLQDQQYAHTGRGGAGNYYSPKELDATGHFSDAHRSHILGDGTAAADDSAGTAPPSYNTAQAVQAPTRTVGRGGAGNYMFGIGESETKAAMKNLEEEKAGEKIKGDIEKGVEETLAVPEKAKLPLEGLDTL